MGWSPPYGSSRNVCLAEGGPWPTIRILVDPSASSRRCATLKVGRSPPYGSFRNVCLAEGGPRPTIRILADPSASSRRCTDSEGGLKPTLRVLPKCVLGVGWALARHQNPCWSLGFVPAVHDSEGGLKPTLRVLRNVCLAEGGPWPTIRILAGPSASSRRCTTLKVG